MGLEGVRPFTLILGAASHSVFMGKDFHSAPHDFHNILWPYQKNLPKVVVSS